VDRSRAELEATEEELEELSRDLLSAKRTFQRAIMKNQFYTLRMRLRRSDRIELYVDELYRALRLRMLDVRRQTPASPEGTPTSGRQIEWGPKVRKVVDWMVTRVADVFKNVGRESSTRDAETYIGFLCVYCGLLDLTKNVGETLRSRLNRSTAIDARINAPPKTSI